MVGETWHRQWRVVDNLVRECVPVIALTVLGVVLVGAVVVVIGDDGGGCDRCWEPWWW